MANCADCDAEIEVTEFACPYCGDLLCGDCCDLAMEVRNPEDY